MATDKLAPPLTNPTIGDSLNEAGVSWAYFQDGYYQANSGNTSIYSQFEFNHNPYLFFANYANGTELREIHLQDTDVFLPLLANGTIPSVSWVKPWSPHNFHPTNSDRTESQETLKMYVDAILASPVWNRTMLIITFDEHGGFFDHVPPPVGDRWGPGSRVPTIVISPFAKKGFVDNTESETLSIHRLIQRRFGLTPLDNRTIPADLTSALVFPSAPTSSGSTVIGTTITTGTTGTTGKAAVTTTSTASSWNQSALLLTIFAFFLLVLV